MEVATLDALLRAAADRWPDKPAVKAVDGRASLTYRELDQLASGFAASFRRGGAAPGDRVVLGFGNSPRFFAALFGCFRAGVVAVPVDPSLAAEELRQLVEHASPVRALVDAETDGMLRPVWENCCPIAREDSVGTSALVLPCTPPATDMPALLLYTSGSTGRPKGVLYSHRMLLAKLDALRRWFGFTPAYTSLCLLPTHFGHGLICNCLVVFSFGGTLVIAPPFNLELLHRLWPIVEEHGVCNFSSVPTVIRLLMQHAAGTAARTPPSLRFVTCASAPLAGEEALAFEGRFGVPLLNCYGLTETTGWSACSPLDPARNRAAVGKALHGQIRVVDAQGRPRPAGEQGQVQIKGPSVFSGYYRHEGPPPDAPDEQGWFSTGDIGEMDDTGTLLLHSRIKDLIIRAGKNVFPAQVDQALMSHPEVLEACAVGLPDALLGEKVAACVVLRQGAQVRAPELMAHVRQRLAAYKCPERIAFVGSIPKSSRGKLQRASMRAFFEAQA